MYEWGGKQSVNRIFLTLKCEDEERVLGERKQNYSGLQDIAMIEPVSAYFSNPVPLQTKPRAQEGIILYVTCLTFLRVNNISKPSKYLMSSYSCPNKASDYIITI